MSSARRVFRPTGVFFAMALRFLLVLVLLVLLELLDYCLVQAARFPLSPACLLTDAKDESAEISSPGFKPLDARAVGQSEAVRVG